MRFVAPLPGERALGPWITGQPNPPGGDDAGAFFAALGSPPLAVPTVLLAAWVLARRLGGRYALLLLAAASVVALTSALKAVLGPTPLWVELFGAGEANFPSGHAAYAASVFGLIVVLARAAGALEVAVVGGMLIGGMGPAALLSRSHLPSDVLAGYALGGAWLLALLAVGLPWAASGGFAPTPPVPRRARG